MQRHIKFPQAQSAKWHLWWFCQFVCPILTHFENRSYEGQCKIQLGDCDSKIVSVTIDVWGDGGLVGQERPINIPDALPIRQLAGPLVRSQCSRQDFSHKLKGDFLPQVDQGLPGKFVIRFAVALGVPAFENVSIKMWNIFLCSRKFDCPACSLLTQALLWVSEFKLGLAYIAL